MKRIGCLDIALRTGWACDSLEAGEIAARVAERGGAPVPGEAEAAVRHGTLKLVSPIGDEDSHTQDQFYEWVRHWIETYRLDAIAAEAPLIAGINMTRTNPTTVELLIKLYGASQLAARHAGADFFKAHRQTVMVHFLGRGNGFAKKPQVIAGCQRIGWYPGDDNAADALAMFHYMSHCFKRPAIVPAGPIFRGKVAL